MVERGTGTLALGGDPRPAPVRTEEHGVDLRPARAPADALDERHQRHQRPQQRLLTERLRQVPLELRGVHQALISIHAGEDTLRGGA